MTQEIAHVHYVKLLAEKCKADERIKELEAENARLRQQRDAANAQLDFILESIKCDTVSEQNVLSQE